MAPKLTWQGKITSVQPRIRLLRSFDQRHHIYLGYVLGIDGDIGGEQRQFTVAIGKAAQAKHQFQVGMEASGDAAPVADDRKETAELYKASKLASKPKNRPSGHVPPPWIDVPPPLEVYRQRGHRRLSARTFTSSCSVCIWGCRMPVEMIIDQWKPSNVRYRFETFCYGPKSSSLYRPAQCLVIPGRKGMSLTEENSIDGEFSMHASGFRCRRTQQT